MKMRIVKNRCRCLMSLVCLSILFPGVIDMANGKDEGMSAKIIRVADYGAKPNDMADASPAIMKALAEAKKMDGKPVVVQFEPGRYQCFGGKPMPDGRTKEPSIQVDKIENVTIDGNGATLVGRDIARLFSISNSKNVTVRNMTVDWDPLPHTSGRIVKVIPELHAYDIAPQIPVKPVAGRIVQGILAYDPALHRLAKNGWEIYQTQGERDAETTQLTPEGNLRIFQKKNTPLPEAGWDVVVRHQVYGYDAFVFAFCSNVLLEDVTVNAVPGMAVIGWNSRDITIRRIKVVPSEGGWMSATADAMHFGSCRGKITVEDSEFAGMGDDAINIHAMYGMATGKIDDHTLEAGRARMHPYYDTVRGIWDAPDKGDIIEYGGGDEPLIPQGQLTVEEARQDNGKQRTIIKFKEKLPAGVGENTVLTNVSTTPAVRISRCKVHGNRARGMLLQTRDILVEDCTFEDVSAAGIHICTDAADWWESLGTRDVTVRNCTFTRCNFGVARREAALDIFSDLPKGRQSAAGVHRRIHLLDNIFEGNGGAAINVGSSDDVEVRGNKIISSGSPAIIIMNSRNVNISGNSPIGDKDVDIRGSSDRATINLKN
ncbi:MAG: right-handed parallel beta-helix repeat-containing protein [Terrimicrobiaceae bacterium]